MSSKEKCYQRSKKESSKPLPDCDLYYPKLFDMNYRQVNNQGYDYCNLRRKNIVL